MGSGRRDPEIREGGGGCSLKTNFLFGLKIKMAHPLESPRVLYYIVISVAATTGVTTSGTLHSGL